MPPRFGSVVLVYYIIAVVMWGGGITAAGPGGEIGLGVASEVVDVNDSTGAVTQNETTGENLQNLGGPIEEAVASLGGGGLLATWNFVKGLLGAMFWPVLLANSVDAPNVVVGFAGALSMGFLVSGLLLIRGAT